MFENFKDFKFEVIDLSVQSEPNIFVNLNGITFSKRVIEDMGYPAYVTFMLDYENGFLGVRACKSNDSKAIKFSKPKEKQTSTVSIGNKVVRTVIRRYMQGKWKDDSRYKIAGTLFPAEKTMVFDLSAAQEQLFKGNIDYVEDNHRQLSMNE